jgi:hypothetical protein
MGSGLARSASTRFVRTVPAPPFIGRALRRARRGILPRGLAAERRQVVERPCAAARRRARRPLRMWVFSFAVMASRARRHSAGDTMRRATPPIRVIGPRLPGGLRTLFVSDLQCVVSGARIVPRETVTP